jgi:hypothetical protein
MKKKAFVLLSIITLSLPLFSQTNLNLNNIELPKFDKRFFFHFDYLGKTENLHFFRGTADYIHVDNYYADIYYQTDLESKKVEAISLLDYNVITNRVSEDRLKVYTYNLSNTNEKHKKVYIDLFEFENFDTDRSTKRIFEFDYSEFKYCRVVMKSSISPDNQKISIVLLVIDNFNMIQKIETVTFDNSDELIWNQSVLFKESNYYYADFYTCLLDNNELIAILNQFQKKTYPKLLLKHTILTISPNDYSFKDIEPNLHQIQMSNVKFLKNGNIVFVDHVFKDLNHFGYNITIYFPNSDQNKNLFIGIPDELQRKSFSYSPLEKKIPKFTFELIDIHEKINGELMFICEDVKSTVGGLGFKRKSQNIYVYQIAADYNSMSTLTIPHSLNFKSYNSSKEFIGMSKIYSYCIENDIYLVYNENIENFKTNTNSDIWLTNDDVYDEKNGIIVTKITDSLSYHSTCLNNYSKSIITLKQTLFFKNDMIYFLTDKHSIGNIEL